jgi:hypothetical protein
MMAEAVKPALSSKLSRTARAWRPVSPGIFNPLWNAENSPRRMTTNPLDDLLDSFDDPSIFGEHFQDARWNAWRALTTAHPARRRSLRPVRARARPWGADVLRELTLVADYGGAIFAARPGRAG